MNGWDAELAHRHSLTTGGVDATSFHGDVGLSGGDHDALLEALVFMDDLDLDSVDGLGLAAVTPEEPVPLGMMATQATLHTHGSNGLAFMPGLSIATDVPLILDSTSFITIPPPATESTSPSPPPSGSQVSDSMPASPFTSVDSSAPAGNNSAPTGCVKGVVNRSRNRRREELLYLRGMVTELEGRLTTLQTRVKEQQEQEARLNGQPQRNHDPVLTAVWEDLAVRQYAQRHRAEVENVKLRRMLEEQIQVGKSLERLLKKRTNLGDTDLHLGGKRPRRSSLSIAWNDAAIFDELVKASATQYLETDSVLRNVNFERGTPNFRDIQVKNDPETGVMIEVTEANVLPFEYELTVQEMFTIFMDQTEQDRFHYHDSKVEDELLKIQFGLTVQIPRAKGELNLKIVSRRFREAQRTVFVWTAFCDPKDVSDTNMDGIYMRHTGWTVVEPLTPPPPSSASSSRSPSTSSSSSSSTVSQKIVGTRTRSYSMAIPETFADVPDQKRKVGTLTNFLLTTTDVQLSSRLQLLENRLVELSRPR